jgi:molybdopterin-guanine dinucleotide biosynthesis protein A
VTGGRVTGRRVKIAGALLAGGKSARFGGRAKAGLRLDDETLAERALRCLREVPGVDDVAVLGHGEGCPDDVPRLADAVDGFGPLAGLLSLLREREADAYLVVPCDLPRLTAAPLRRLVDQAIASDARCALLTFGERTQPLPLFARADVLPELEAAVAEGRRRLVRFVESLEPLHVPAGDDAAALADADTPEQLDELVERGRNESA